MGIRGLFKRGKQEKRTVTKDNVPWIVIPSASGVNVNESTAIEYVPWYAGVSLIADSIAMLPFGVFRSTDTGRVKDYAHNLYALLNCEANSYQSSHDFIHLLTTWALHLGNGYAEIERDTAGKPVAFWPIPPGCVTSRLQEWVNPAGKTLIFQVYDVAYNGITGAILAENMLHIRGLSLNGVYGINPTASFRDAIGNGIAKEQYEGTFFANSATPPGAIVIPGSVSDEDAKQILADWNNRFGGVANRHKTALLQAGAKYETFDVPNNENSQFVECRNYSIADVCRILRIPPHKLGLAINSSYSSFEQQAIDFVTYTLMPWLTRWRSEINRKCLSMADRAAGVYCEHVTEALMRGDTDSRYKNYAVGIQWGWLSPNQVCERENLPTFEGGDEHLQPLNMILFGSNAPKPTEPAQSVQNASESTPAEPTPTERAIDANAFRGLFTDICGRIVRRETGAIRKAVKNRQELEPIYDEHYAYMYETLVPAIRSIALAKKINVAEAENKLKATLNEYRSLSIEQLKAQKIETVLIDWETSKANALTDTLLS